MIRLLMVNDMSRKEMMDALNLKGRDNFEKNYIRPALEEGIIERTEPNSPNSPTQKYRLTEKGFELINGKF